MLWIQLSEMDLAGTRVAAVPHPALETALSLSVLGGRSEQQGMEQWRRRVVGRLPQPTRVLLEWSETTKCRSRLLDVVMTGLTQGRDVGFPTAPAVVVSALQAYQRVAIEPLWPRILASVKDDLGTRAQIMLHGGPELLLSTLTPNIRWQRRRMGIPCCSRRQATLEGRGLLLVPSFFCWRGPILAQSAEGTPVLVYPVLRGEGLSEIEQQEARTSAERSLVALLGRTRATVFRAVCDGCNTSELSRRVGVSMSTASEHACVLRDAGLISSQRQRNEMVHRLTPLGAALLARHHWTGTPPL
jgi:DNA-binding transcriptional ArsR family regulator